MKTIHTALGIIFAAVPLVLEAQGHLPQPCAESAHPPPDSFLCPTPYVELTPPGEPDPVFERAWYCRENEHALGLVRGSDGSGGCGGSGDGLAMFQGWDLPSAPAIVTTADSSDVVIAEIDTHVVKPCFLVGIRGNVVFSQMDETAALNFLMVQNAGDVETMRNSILPLIEGKSLGERMDLYAQASVMSLKYV